MKLAKTTLVVFTLLLTIALIPFTIAGAIRLRTSIDVGLAEHRMIAAHGAGIAEQYEDYDELAIAEILAEDVKKHISYDYALTKPWTHNLKIKVSFGSTSYKTYEENGYGICTDFCQVYACLLQGAGINAEYVDRIKVSETAEHAYVDIHLQEHTYRIDITSYCTAEHNNATTNFTAYVKEV